MEHREQLLAPPGKSGAGRGMALSPCPQIKVKPKGLKECKTLYHKAQFMAVKTNCMSRGKQ